MKDDNMILKKALGIIATCCYEFVPKNDIADANSKWELIELPGTCSTVDSTVSYTAFDDSTYFCQETSLTTTTHHDHITNATTMPPAITKKKQRQPPVAFHRLYYESKQVQDKHKEGKERRQEIAQRHHNKEDARSDQASSSTMTMTMTATDDDHITNATMPPAAIEKKQRQLPAAFHRLYYDSKQVQDREMKGKERRREVKESIARRHHDNSTSSSCQATSPTTATHHDHITNTTMSPAAIKKKQRQLPAAFHRLYYNCKHVQDIQIEGKVKRREIENSITRRYHVPVFLKFIIPTE